MYRYLITGILLSSISACGGGGGAQVEQKQQPIDMKTFVMNEIGNTADDTEAVDISGMVFDMSNEDDSAFDEALK